MSDSQNSHWKTRLIEGGFPDRGFDIEFWREQGDEAIFSAAWEMVELAEEVRHGRNPHYRELLRLLNEFEFWYSGRPQNACNRDWTRTIFSLPLTLAVLGLSSVTNDTQEFGRVQKVGIENWAVAV